MVHSVEVLFDPDTEAAVRRSWDELSAAGSRSLAAHTAPSNRPHVTLAVADQMDDAVDDALRLALGALPFACTIGAPMVFTGRALILVRLLVPSAELIDLHATVHRLSLPHMPNGPLPHTDPGQWTPHVTLARRVAPDQLSTALAVDSMSRDIRGSVVGLRHWDGNARVEHLIR